MNLHTQGGDMPGWPEWRRGTGRTDMPIDCIGCGQRLTEDYPRPFCEGCDECARSNPEWSEQVAIDAGLLERPEVDTASCEEDRR